MEVDIRGRAHRVVGIEHRPHPSLAQDAHDGGMDTCTGVVGDNRVEKLGRYGAAGADQVTAVEPIPGNAFEIAQKMQFGNLVGAPEVFE